METYALLGRCLMATILVLFGLGQTIACEKCQWKNRIAHPLLIGAFNVRVFGKNKMGKPDVVRALVQIIRRYDLILIQEIRDSKGKAFPELVAKVNAESMPAQYEYVLSPREGRTIMKEQYGFIYRVDRLEPVLQYSYNDTGGHFERPPYVISFRRTTQTGVQQIFSFIPLHAKPSSAIGEINALELVYMDSIVRTGTGNAVIAGDFNADCDYVCRSCWSRVTLRHNKVYHWLIGDEVDTTTFGTHCAYDRVVVTGSMMGTAFGGKVYEFDRDLGLSTVQAGEVSDHYPVEFTMI